MRRCIEQLNRDAKIDHVPTASEQLLHLLKQVILISGGVAGTSESDKENLKKVREIVEQCFDVQRVIREDVASTDFEILYSPPGTPYSAALMDDIDDDGRGRTKKPTEGTPILCTSDLGLKRREKLDDSANGKIESFVMLKTKVMLPSQR